MTPTSLQLDRVVAAAPVDVWRAWTTADGLATWWWHTWPDTRYAVDAAVGGHYRIEAADHGIGVRGEYRVLQPPHRLAFSWIWFDHEDGTTVDGPVEEVEVTFEADGTGTRVRVRHTGPWSTPEPVENYHRGWDFVLDALAAVPLGR